MVIISTKLMIVVNSEEGGKKTGLRRVHRPHLVLYLFLFEKKNLKQM